jgi:poly-gamma-glutamate synthesis protein (capsule biosynthesis protein)
VADDVVSLFLCGDVMLGRGVDQILAHPGDPALREAVIRDARDYVRLAEQLSGPIPRPVDDSWPWGEALAVLDEAAPDVRVVNLAVGMASSGIPPGWAAVADAPGVALVEPSRAAAAQLVLRVQEHRRPGDLVVVSIHWGSNWGYGIPREQVDFAHALVDGGVDVVHGHSSHHPRPVGVYRDRLVLYGCGDLVDDYEGITGHEAYRDDLRLLYLVSVARDTGALVGVRIVPLQARRMRLEHASHGDAEWLRDVLDRVSRPFGAGVGHRSDGTLALRAR